jgi:hypothetical protein
LTIADVVSFAIFGPEAGGVEVVVCDVCCTPLGVVAESAIE